MSEALALVVLAASLLAAIARWRWAPDWAVAAAGAVLLVAVGVLSTSSARSAVSDLGPTVGFLAALLILADGCRRAGMFDALGAHDGPRLAGTSRPAAGDGVPRRRRDDRGAQP